MRRAAPLALAAVTLLAPIGGWAQTTSDPAPDQPRPPADKRLLTPDQQGRQGIVKGVVEQPLRDFNVMRSKIPPVLVEAMQDAYARPQPATCAGIARDVSRLDAVLGPDLDAPISTANPGLVARSEGAARSLGLDAMRSGVQDYIPFDGVIRVVTGADHHDHVVMAAIQAGAIRRGYLKGLGEAQRCPPPAVPLHLAYPVSVAQGASDKPQ